MSDIILHHYAGSLFSEKIRLLLGYLKLPWKSVVTAPIMPRPLLMPLTGGYRRTPNMQQGADVWCDSKIIAERLAEIAGDTSLHTGFVSNRVAEWADSHLFRVVVAVTFQPRAAGAAMSTLSSTQIEAFMKDRAELTKGGADRDDAAGGSGGASRDVPRRTRRGVQGAVPVRNEAADRGFLRVSLSLAGRQQSDDGAAARALSERHGVARADGGVRARQGHRNQRRRSARHRHQGDTDADSERPRAVCRKALRSVNRRRWRRPTTAWRFRSAANW